MDYYDYAKAAGEVSRAVREGKTSVPAVDVRSTTGFGRPKRDISHSLNAFIRFMELSEKDNAQIGQKGLELWALAFVEGREWEKASHYGAESPKLYDRLQKVERLVVGSLLGGQPVAVYATDEGQAVAKLRRVGKRLIEDRGGNPVLYRAESEAGNREYHKLAERTRDEGGLWLMPWEAPFGLEGIYNRIATRMSA